MEVESHMYEVERNGEGLFFMRTQSAIQAETVTPEQVFGEWTLFKEFEKPLCKLTLSSDSAGGENYKIAIKPCCDPSVPDVERSTSRLDRARLLLSGPGGRRRVSTRCPTAPATIPPPTHPLRL